MADYLIAHGLAPNRLILEDQSTSTEENLRFSRRLLEQQGANAAADPLILVTSDFHLMRAMRIARKVGFGAVVGAAVETPAYLRYNAWLREYFAVISGWVLREF
ncbi:Integral membrane protein (fragment) [Cupriavidus taiwanensis]|uniref:Integral membrane protein n=2 Tax=Cupriavidus taiwanensis TaxID=164546 RepID=A0A9Q7XM64_9BURK